MSKLLLVIDGDRVERDLAPLDVMMPRLNDLPVLRRTIAERTPAGDPAPACEI